MYVFIYVYYEEKIMADIDYDKLQRTFENALNRASASGMFKGTGGGSGGGTTSGGSTAFDKNSAFSKYETKINEFTDNLSSISKVVDSGISTFQRLSSVGSNFSNDIIGMSVAAANTRMSLYDFEKVISNNNKNFAGLGGSVARGTEVFSRFSKEFFDTGFNQELERMGYTTSEINEVMATYLSGQRSSYVEDAEGKRRAMVAAKELAIELDAVAKITGKSKQEQLEQLKKSQVEGGIQAKMRLLAQETGRSVEDIKAEFDKQATNYAKYGPDAVEAFKEFYASGTYLTKGSQTYAALMGEQTRAMERDIRASQAGDFQAARRAREEADAAAMANANDKNLLQLTTVNQAIGGVGSVLTKMVESTSPMAESVAKIAKANGMLLETQTDYANALKMLKKDIEMAQRGYKLKEGTGIGVEGRTQYVKQSNVTEALIGAGTVKRDIVSGSATLGGEALKQAGDKLANQLTGYVTPARIGIVETEKQGLQGSAPKEKLPADASLSEKARVDRESGGAVGAGVRGVVAAGKLIGDSIGFILDKVTNVTVTNPGNISVDKKMAEGGVVNEPTLALIGEAGPETVIPNKEIDNVIKSAVSRLMPAAKSTMNTATTGGIDLSKISKDISITMGSAVSKMAPDFSPILKTASQTDESKKYEEQRNRLENELAEYKKTALEDMKTKMGPGTSEFKAQRALNKDEIFNVTVEEAEKELKRLERKIAEGIQYETLLKNNQVDETKKAATEQQAIEKLSLDTVTKFQKLASAELIEISDQAATDLFKNTENMSGIFNDLNVGMSDVTKTFLDVGDSFDGLGNISPEMSKVTDVLMDAQQDFIGSLMAGATSTNATAIDADRENKKMAERAKTITEVAPQSVTGPIDLNRLTIGPDGMPRFSSVDSAKKDIAKPATPAATTAQNESAAAADKNKTEQKKPSPAPSETGKKQVDLSDVVEALNRVNTQLTTLVSINEDIGNKQLRATKANSNLHKV